VHDNNFPICHYLGKENSLFLKNSGIPKDEERIKKEK